MRSLKLYIACSLDGKIARKNGAVDWLPDPSGDDYGYQALYDSVDTLLMGHATYQVCLGFGEWHYKEKTSWVFSRKHHSSSVPQAHFTTEAPPDFVRKLKESPGKDIWLVGGGQLISCLHNAGLIDEYIIAQVPLILGEGISLFPDASREQILSLKEHRQFKNGVTLGYYRNMENSPG